MNAPITDIVATCVPWPEWQLQAGRLRVSYREAGRGPVVVLLHGIGSGAGSWHGLASVLARHCRVVAWDAPGYGDSAALSKQHPNAGDYAAVLGDFIDALGLPKFYLVGHSLGAMMASAYAAANAGKLNGLLLADPAQGYGGADAEERRRVSESRVRLLRELGAEGYAERRAEAMLGTWPTPEALEAVRASMRRLREDGFAPANWMLAHDDIWRYLPAWRGPLTVVCGDADAITPPADVSVLAGRMGVSCRLLAGAGHASYLDAPEAFAALVLDGMSGCTAAFGEAREHL